MKQYEDGVFEDEYIVSFIHVGIYNCLTNKNFLSFMEDLAGSHSNFHHFTFSDLAKDNLSWVLLSWKLQVFERPKDDEKIIVKTWGRFFNKVFVLRDFEVFNEDNKLIAQATSKWCLVDITKHKIARMPENLDEIYGGFPSKSVFGISDIPRLSVPSTEPINHDSYKIRRFDLDLNRHVHNLNYLDYAYEVLPMDVFMNSEFNNVEIDYRREIKLNDVIHMYLYEEDGVYTIVIKDDEDKIIHSIIKLYN